MAIVSGETVIKGTQANGYLTIQHRYTDNTGKVHMLPTKHVAPDFDYDADRLVRVARVEAQLVGNEIGEKLKAAKEGLDLVDDPLQYQTKVELITAIVKRLWAMDVCEASDYKGVLTRLSNLTDNQLATITGASPTAVKEWINDLLAVAAVRAKYD